MASINKNFVVKNGIEVGEGLIYGNNQTGRVGLGTTNPTTDIDLYGTTSVDDLIISGTVSVGNTIGKSSQYLRATGTGVTWSDFPSLRTGFTTTAQGSQVTFSSSGFTYSPGLIDVYINGTRLRGNGLSDVSEFTAADGSTIVLQNACFGGETVDVFGYSGISGGLVQQTTGITVLEEGSIVGVAQSIQSINFVGAAVTAVGSGIGVTIYVNDSVNPNYWVSTATGIHTLSNVGIGTTNPTSALTVQGDVSVSGIATVDGITLKSKNNSYSDNIIITQHPAATFTGNRNVAIGDYSFTTPGAAGENVAIGYYALNVVGNNNIVSTYNGNTAVGAFAGEYCTTTLRNTLIGWRAGRLLTGPVSGSGENTIIGAFDGNSFGLDIRTSSNNVVLSDGAGNIRFYANSSGNVGLGTTNPTSTLTVRGGDISVGINTSQGVILTSPNGTQYRLIVADNGTLSTVSV